MLYNQTLTINNASYLCSFIVREVKENVVSCGGNTVVAAIPNDANRQGRAIFYQEASVFAGFPRTIVPLLIQCRDMRIKDADFWATFKQFEVGLSIIRQQERTATNTAEMMKYGLPLPDAGLGSEEATRLLAEAKERLAIESEPSASEKSVPEA